MRLISTLISGREVELKHDPGLDLLSAASLVAAILDGHAEPWVETAAGGIARRDSIILLEPRDANDLPDKPDPRLEQTPEMR